MEEIVERNRCTGCSACMNICPKKAIKMVEDDKGFLHPVIDQKKCINCGLCKNTCPVINTSKNESINKCYVAYNKSVEDRLNSSSGSIFSLLAEYILKDDGLVVDAYLDKDKLKHIIIDNISDLYKLRGSKYLQSDLSNVFSSIKDSLNNKKVLFVGTPCQVAGLKAYLHGDMDNLICIDLFCHGVPSPKLFKKSVNELEEKYNDKLVNYNFRDNSTGWDSYSNKAIFKKKVIKELQCNNDYMKLFLSDVALRESCFQCNFKLGNKYSDITLGDFWGVKNVYPEMYNKEGVSAVIINTEKGKKLFNKVNRDIDYKECNIEDILQGNPSLQKSSKKPSNYFRFWNDFDKVSVEELSKKYTRKSILRKIINKSKSIIIRIIKK